MFFSFHLVVLLKWCRTVYKFNSNQVFTAWYQLCWLYWTINEHTCRRRGPFLFCGGTHVLDLFCPNHESMPDSAWSLPNVAWFFLNSPRICLNYHISKIRGGGGGTVPPISYAYVNELKLWASKIVNNYPRFIIDMLGYWEIKVWSTVACETIAFPYKT